MRREIYPSLLVATATPAGCTHARESRAFGPLRLGLLSARPQYGCDDRLAGATLRSSPARDFRAD